MINLPTRDFYTEDPSGYQEAIGDFCEAMSIVEKLNYNFENMPLKEIREKLLRLHKLLRCQ